MHHLISPACFLISSKYIPSITAVQRCQILCNLDVRTLHVPEENADKKDISAKENKYLWRKKAVKVLFNAPVKDDVILGSPGKTGQETPGRKNLLSAWSPLVFLFSFK